MAEKLVRSIKKEVAGATNARKRTFLFKCPRWSIFNPSAVPFIPCQRCQSLEPVRCHSREGVEGGPQGLSDEFQAVEHPDGGQHMGRVGALRPTGLEEPQHATPLEQLLQQHLFGPARQQTVPELAQDRKAESRI